MKNSNNVKNMTTTALLLGIGAILHAITPTLGLPMQPDFSLVMLFIIMILNRRDYKTVLMSGIITGIFTALTTKFPGGQIPNMLDKIITANLAFILLSLIDRLPSISSMTESKKRFLQSLIIMPIGTIISGTVFLGSASVLVGLPGGASFNVLFISTVLPAIIINMFAGSALFKVVSLSLTRANIKC